MDLIERARKYVEKLEAPRRAASDSQDSHAVVFQAAVVLVQGFSLPVDVARALLVEYCGRSDAAWSEREIEHKLREAEKANPREKKGWLVGADAWRPSVGMKERLPLAMPKAAEKPVYVPEALAKLAAPYAGLVDQLWLANRSAMDPAVVTSAGFLEALYDRATEKVVTFNIVNQKGQPWTQGEAMWPEEEERLPGRGVNGVFYLAAPVDGKSRATDRVDRDGNVVFSRRDGACVVSWRWLVVESDDAPAGLWLAGIARLPLKICALYTSGGRSVHALIRTPARTKEEWDEFKAGLRPALLTLGADPGCLSAVRLTRLPGTWRTNKNAAQKLLYVNPRADGRPLVELPELRDVEGDWCAMAARGPSDTDETEGKWIRDALGFYAKKSRRCREALAEFGKGAE